MGYCISDCYHDDNLIKSILPTPNPPTHTQHQRKEPQYKSNIKDLNVYILAPAFCSAMFEQD